MNPCTTCGTEADSCSYSQNPALGRGDCCPECRHEITTMRDVAQAIEGLRREVRSMALTRCRYLDQKRVQCTGEAVDPDADVLLCIRHLGQAMALLKGRGIR